MKDTLHKPFKATIGFLRRGYSASGGAEAYLARLAEELFCQGYRVILLGTGDWPHEKWPGGEVVVLPHQTLRKFAKAALEYKKQGPVSIDLLFSLERVPGVDIFRAGDGVHAAWLEHRRRGVSFWKRFFSLGNLRHREVLKLEKELFHPRSSTRVIANSSMVAKEIVEHFDFPKSQITVIPNGVSPNSAPTEQKRESARKELGISDEEFMILFVGSGWKRKGLSMAQHAVECFISSQKAGNKKIPSLRLWVAGKGPSQRYVSPHTKFLGATENISLLTAAADLFILPTWYDPFSNATLEALAAGVPVITSGMNGCSEIMISGIHGSVVRDPHDLTGFVAALEEWCERLQNREEADVVRVRCAELGAKWSIKKNSTATIEVIAQVL